MTLHPNVWTIHPEKVVLPAVTHLALCNWKRKKQVGRCIPALPAARSGGCDHYKVLLSSNMPRPAHCRLSFRQLKSVMCLQCVKCAHSHVAI